MSKRINYFLLILEKNINSSLTSLVMSDRNPSSRPLGMAFSAVIGYVLQLRYQKNLCGLCYGNTESPMDGYSTFYGKYHAPAARFAPRPLS